MMLDDSPYQGYLYAYPHKTAYRPLLPRPRLRDVWRDESRDSLFLYIHIPFCEMRCGFCNLFTRSRPPAEQVTDYLAQLRRQAQAVAEELPDATFARAAIGGGTPTYLTVAELTELFAITGMSGLGLSVETSPATATPDRLQVLADNGVHRVSIGVQSFLDAEAHAAGRPQRVAQVQAALGNIRAANVPVLNIDLIYGIAGQTAATWASSLEQALRWQPEELYLYPLYVRPLTGLDKRGQSTADDEWDIQRLALYRHGRDTLRANGYRQMSMRQFRRDDVPDPQAPDYCCQDDGMIGLGCGARSYTSDLHYSFDYAVGIGEVRAIIDDYVGRPQDDFRFAEHGFRLDLAEQRRRWLLKSLLRAEGLDETAYTQRFGSEVIKDFPILTVLGDRGWMTTSDGRLRLTDSGLERGDAIGPWLVSDTVRNTMQEYATR